MGNAESAWDAAAAGAEVVRSSINARRLADPALDLASIEREARAAQSAWIASGLKSCFTALSLKLSARAHTQRDGMKAMTDNTVEWSGISKRLDDVAMSEYDRWQAKESLRSAELIVEALLSLTKPLGFIVYGVEHGALSMASGLKTLFARPVKH
ncbi:MAG: hypothetical protein A3G25_10760 [Betaproteobacteria bacterium RIFCSPLOWO2_12_FULL_63_13]|nr:MAG: hypothetical protein A3H32_05885 [Betaproteobacteria bacterium RIFCSPLOWO2_02_FULL_63_19]OGA53025.1 MAG: hypothetical protein A3G25_10760 [Betaproteobacteria bacterium RIFCSPLOWO2_12_FULL_63_13]